MWSCCRRGNIFFACTMVKSYPEDEVIAIGCERHLALPVLACPRLHEFGSVGPAFRTCRRSQPQPQHGRQEAGGASGRSLLIRSGRQEWYGGSRWSTECLTLTPESRSFVPDA